MPLRSWLRRKPSEAEASSSSSPSSSSSSSSKRRGGKELSRSSSRKQGSSSSRGKKSLAMVDADATTVTAEDAAGPALDKAAAPSSTSSVSTATTDASSSAATASSPSSSASSSRRRRSGSSSKKKAASEKQADEGAPGGGDADDGTTELNAEDLLAALYDSGELDEEEMDLVEQMEEPEEEADDGALNRPTSSTKKTKKTKKKSTTTTATRKAKKGKKGTAVSGGGKKSKRGGRKSGKARKVKPGKREDDDSSSSCSSSSSSASSASDSSSCDSASGSGSSSEDGSEEVAVLDDDVDDDDEDSSAADDVFIGGFDMEHADDDDSRDFACLSPIDIAREQSKEVSVVAETLSVNRDAATALLKHFQWKRERLLAEYFENPEKVRDEAGVSADASTVTLTAGDADGLDVAPAREDPFSSDAAEGGDGLSSPASAGAGGGASAAAAGAGATTAAATPSVVSGAIELEGEGMCDICADDVPAEDCTALGCQHRFCNDCWGHYLSLKIREGHTTLPCMTSGCRLVCDEATVRRLVASDIFDKYLHFVTKSYVDDSGASVKWCPAPGCGNAITSDLISGGVVRCTCGHRFCFKCHREAHAPASCEQVHLWEKKCKDDSETDHWKYANAKECPKCDVATEKNGGCNHMSCRQCKHEWCWVCTRPWKGHSDYYNCNRYKRPDPSAASGGGGGAAASSSSSGGSRLGGLFGRKSKKDRRLEREAERERNRLALERYLHYFERFSTHSHSRDLEQQIRARAIGKIDELSAEVTTSSELQYIRDGTDALLESRNVLKYTYVFAYYLPTTGPERELFEYLQEHLEKTTESLSEVLEHPDSSQEYRLRAVNTIQLAKTRVNNLLSAVEQGLTDDSGEA